MGKYRLRFPLWYLEFAAAERGPQTVALVVHAEARGNRSGLLFPSEAAARAFRDTRPSVGLYTPAAIARPPELLSFLDALEGGGFRHVAIDTGRGRVMAYAAGDLREHIRAAVKDAGAPKRR